MAQALADVVENEALAEAILEHIFAVDHGVLSRVLSEVGPSIDFVYLAEDLAAQGSLLMSPAVFRRFLKPRLRKLADLVHAHGVRVFQAVAAGSRPRPRQGE